MYNSFRRPIAMRYRLLFFKRLLKDDPDTARASMKSIMREETCSSCNPVYIHDWMGHTCRTDVNDAYCEEAIDKVVASLCYGCV